MYPHSYPTHRALAGFAAITIAIVQRRNIARAETFVAMMAHVLTPSMIVRQLATTMRTSNVLDTAPVTMVSAVGPVVIAYVEMLPI